MHYTKFGFWNCPLADIDIPPKELSCNSFIFNQEFDQFFVMFMIELLVFKCTISAAPNMYLCILVTKKTTKTNGEGKKTEGKIIKRDKKDK